MTLPHDSASAIPGEPIVGEPLLSPPDVTDHGAAVVEPVDPITPVETLTGGAASSAPTPPPGEHDIKTRDDAADEGSSSKIKAAALVAGVAAIANKVRQEAPKKVQEFRQRRAVGRCIIVTEADGRYLAIGPYKDAEAANQDIFKVGGNPHVAELMSDTDFFARPVP